MSVESLERAHREESKTPPVSQRNTSGLTEFNEMPPIPSKATSATDLETDLKSKLNISKAGHIRQNANLDKNNGTSKPGASLHNNNQSYAGAAKSPNKKTQKVNRKYWLRPREQRPLYSNLFMP